jgi:cytochrome c oxidase cbb3-type subunit 3
MAKNLKEQGLPGHDLQQQEIIALIAYLQQIPTGPQRRYNDSLWMSAFKNQAAAWDKAITTDSNRLMRLAGSTNKDTVVMGARLFNERYCWVCHGRQGEGGAGPNLTDSYWLHGSSSTAIMQVIANGKPDRGMQGFKTQISPEEIGLLTAYINALKNTDPPNAKAPQGNKYW